MTIPKIRSGSKTRWLPLVLALIVCWMASGSPPVHAEQPPAAGTVADPKVRQWLDLLDDPSVRTFLDRARTQGVAQPPSDAPASTMTVSLATKLEALRAHLGDLLRSSGEFSTQTQMAHRMGLDALRQEGLWSTVVALAIFVALGFGAQGLFHVIGRPFRRWLLALKLDRVDERVRAVFARLLYALGLLLFYALGSIGAFLLFAWPPLIKQLLLGLLVAFLMVRLAAVAGRFLLAPGGERFRLVPVTTRTAWFLYRRGLAFATILAFGTQIIAFLAGFGLSSLADELSRDVLGLVLMLIALEAVWRIPDPASTDRPAPATSRHRAWAWGLSLASLLMWICWVVQARTAFWLVAFAAGLPLVVVTARASVTHILRPVGNEPAPEVESLQALLFARGIRSLVLISAAVLLALVFGVDLATLSMQDSASTLLIRGAASVAVIGFSAEFLWTVIHATIDRKLRRPLPLGIDNGHAARMQTLLPIFSNMLLATVVIVAAMMMLAALGVQIGPLIASAGVVGVAIGFGAQTLVKDVISGIFYLVDDAFRIGEYIQSGNYKGTVESFSLRSVKLRHQRGALYTIPFGSLGAVQNQSRDWVVDKILLNVPYGTDLEKVRKLIKKIGAELSEDPELGPDILAPLKMQGVSQFGDFAIQIQTKMMTRPGDAQFAGRRRALLLIKRNFEENGIGFAVPTVQVAGDQAPTMAAPAFAALNSLSGDGKAAAPNTR